MLSVCPSVCPKCLLLWNYASYWDETLRICRAMSTFRGIQFSEILDNWKWVPLHLSLKLDKFENLHLWSVFHENWYMYNIFIHVKLENKSKNYIFVKWFSPMPPSPLLKFKNLRLWSDYYGNLNISSLCMCHYKAKVKI